MKRICLGLWTESELAHGAGFFFIPLDDFHSAQEDNLSKEQSLAYVGFIWHSANWTIRTRKNYWKFWLPQFLCKSIC